MIDDINFKSKVLILFVLEKLEMPINEGVLIQMCCLDNDWISYFYFPTLINELASADLINRHLDENSHKEYVISLNENGKVCLSYFFKDIYKSERDNVTEYIRANKLKYRKIQEFTCNYKKNKDGSFKVTCAVKNAESNVFEISFTVPTQEKAVSVRNKWASRATDFYRLYTDLLID